MINSKTVTQFSTKSQVLEEDVSSHRVISRVRAAISNEISHEEKLLSFFHQQYFGNMNDPIDSDENDSLLDNFDCGRSYFDWEMQPDDGSEAGTEVRRPFMSRVRFLRKWGTSIHDKVPIEIIVTRTNASSDSSSSFKLGERVVLVISERALSKCAKSFVPV